MHKLAAATLPAPANLCIEDALWKHQAGLFWSVLDQIQRFVYQLQNGRQRVVRFEATAASAAATAERWQPKK
jgi:hypothetical protein